VPPPAAIVTSSFIGRIEVVQPTRQGPRLLAGGRSLLWRHLLPLPQPGIGIGGLSGLRLHELGRAALREPRRQQLRTPLICRPVPYPLDHTGQHRARIGNDLVGISAAHRTRTRNGRSWSSSAPSP
jgi:hypothetical protein